MHISHSFFFVGSGAFRRGRDRDLGGAFRYSRKLTRLYGQAPLGLEGSGAFRRPGSMVRALRTGPWVQPTERAGSEGSFICRCLGQRKPYNRPAGVEMHSPSSRWHNNPCLL